jgi:hypothetical protein
MSTQAIKWAFDVLSSSKLGPTERCVLHFLGFRHHHKTGECFPAMKTIGDHAGVSERRARDAIRNLEAAGLIKSHRRVGQAGNSSNQYVLFGRPSDAVQPGTKKPGETGTRVPGPDRHQRAGDKKVTPNPSHDSLAKRKKHWRSD